MAVLYVVLAGALLTACGDQQDPRDDAGSSASPTSTGDPTTMPSTNPSQEPTGDRTLLPSGKPGARLQLTGTVSPGVESGCHLLTSGGTTYLLMWNGKIVDGQRVEVVGAVRADAMGTCQQGVPFQVERLTVSETP